MPPHASPRLASFGLIAHRTGSPYSLALEMRAVRISSSYQLPLYIYRLPKPVPDFQSSSFPSFSVSALRPPSGVFNQPTWHRLSQAPPLVNSLSKVTSLPYILWGPPRWRCEDPQHQTRSFY